ncbi:MAG: PTS cellobiose transporter subunit IIC [Bacteroidaceae bacterium]|nr:PTS cellobiose transporter subunit IIC [Bacteroidaceae bacterium]
MFKKAKCIITATDNGSIKDMCRSILSQIDEKRILKIIFFYLPASDSDYLLHNKELRECVKEYFPTATPLVSYVAQKPECGALVAEVVSLADSDATVERKARYTLLRKGNCREIMSEGIIPADITASTFSQANDIFATVGAILDENGFTPSDIYRQWNYIQGITVLNDGSQNYQEFNDARSLFYAGGSWSNGYPAATGIGTSRGGVMIEFSAIKDEEVPNKPIDNPLQVAAHNYSQEVLDGKVIEELKERTTPKFERARILGSTIFISGTAAIKGEHSNHSANAVEQTAETMEIMDNLVSKENIPVENNGSHYRFLRVYVKNECDIPAVRGYMSVHYPTAGKHYLVADICRPELLVEIEGLAHI